MSDYTPTTEEVRNTFSAATWEWGATTLDDAEQEFDRWLAEVKSQQDKATTKRIIRLLTVEGHRLDSSDTRYFRDGLVRAVRLIRGENNE